MEDPVKKCRHPILIDETAHTWHDHAKPKLIEAMKHALMKHGDATTDPVRGVANLAEEVGECASEALEITRPFHLPNPLTERYITERYEKLINELAQVAGYATLLMISMEGVVRRRKLKEGTDVQP